MEGVRLGQGRQGVRRKCITETIGKMSDIKADETLPCQQGGSEESAGESTNHG